MTINILQIIKGLDIGGDSGGAELFGIKLARELHKIPDCQIWICAYYSVGTEMEKEWLDKLNKEGINTFFVSEWGGYNNIAKFIKGLFKLATKISKLNIDVCHSHFQLGTLAAIILKFFGYTKTAYRTSHIRKEWDQGKWTLILSSLFIKRIFPKYLDGEIGVSKAVYDYLVNRRPGKIEKAKIHLIYNGIDISLIRAMGNEPLTEEDIQLFSQSNHNIGCVGRLAEQKGYPYIIRAMPNVISHYPDAMLYIVGDGELKSELIDLVHHLSLTRHIKFLGLRNDVPALLHQWNLFVLPSLWEGFPTVVMEAMISEVPVIATNIPGTTELVVDGETGFLVPEKDPDNLSDTIIKVFNNPDMTSQLVRNAKKHAEKYSMQNIAKSYYQLFETNV
jgi:glycosyltransferase involved in cell wall biosynthesis